MQPNSEFLLILSSVSLVSALAFMLVAWFQWRAAVAAQAKAAQLELAQAGGAHLPQEAERLRIEVQLEREKCLAAEKDLILAQQRLKDMDTRIKDADEFKKAALASVLEGGQTLSSKLLEDHKRETKQAREEQEQLAFKTTKTLMDNFVQLTSSVAAIQSKNTENTKQMETVMRALTHPGGAGQMAEAGLENALKALGLEAGRDFILQYHVAVEDGNNLRPDAVIFLSQDMVVVIDSKASKFMMELAEAEKGQEEAVLKKLLGSVHQHIDTLARKSYADGVTKTIKEHNRRIGRVMMVMYLPSEALIERLHKADRGISEKCLKSDIILSGPASLAAILSLSRQQISSARQDENQQKIVVLVRELMDAMITSLSYVDAMGRHIGNTVTQFDKFGRSFNRFVLPKLHKLQKLGVEPAKNKALPQPIGTWEIQKSSDMVIIEGNEVEEAEVPALLIREGA